MYNNDKTIIGILCKTISDSKAISSFLKHEDFFPNVHSFHYFMSSGQTGKDELYSQILNNGGIYIYSVKDEDDDGEKQSGFPVKDEDDDGEKQSGFPLPLVLSNSEDSLSSVLIVFLLRHQNLLPLLEERLKLFYGDDTSFVLYPPNFIDDNLESIFYISDNDKKCSLVISDAISKSHLH